MTEGPEKQVSRRDAMKTALGAAVGGIGAGGLIGAELQEASDKKKMKEQAQQSIDLGDWIEAAQINRTLDLGGTVKLELKRDKETGRIQGSGELFDENGKQIPGGFIKLK